MTRKECDKTMTRRRANVEALERPDVGTSHSGCAAVSAQNHGPAAINRQPKTRNRRPGTNNLLSRWALLPLWITNAVGWQPAAIAQSDCASIRVWPSATVVDDHIRLDGVCELKGFGVEIERALREVVLAEAPVPGGSRVIHIDLIRAAVTAAGANMATTRLFGATRCEVRRPVVPAAESSAATAVQTRANATAGSRDYPVKETGSSSRDDTPGRTLRSAVVDHFSQELARFGGSAEVIFDKESAQMLDLSDPPYRFNVRRRGGSPLGLTSIEVDILAAGDATIFSPEQRGRRGGAAAALPVRMDTGTVSGVAAGDVVQSVPLVVQVSLLRYAVVARRAINQDAMVRAGDVDRVAMSFTRLDQLGLEDTAQAVGQRAKRFIPAGTLLDPAMLEPVPLVVRGQLVTLVAESGPVRVVTSGKAADDGLFGERVRVRASDSRRLEFDGRVIGPGEVQIGAIPRVIRVSQKERVSSAWSEDTSR